MKSGFGFFATIGLATILPACVHIPDHDFEASAPPVAVAPPVPGTVVVTAQNISSRPLEDALRGNIPPRIDAQRFGGGCANPCFRFAQRSSAVSLISGRFQLGVSYGGYLQAAGSFGDCRLEPFYLGAQISARPAARKVGNSWVIAPIEVHATGSIEPGSDTHCSLVGLNVRELLQGKLQERANGLGDQVAAQRIPIPVEDLATKLLGPLEFLAPDGMRYCVYSRISDIQIGTIAAASGATTPAGSLPSKIDIPVAFMGAPTLILTRQACPPAEPVAGPVLSENATSQPYRLLATVAADYPSLSQFASEKLKPIHTRWGPFKFTFKPTKIDIGNASGVVFAAVKLTGSVSGTVYFWGTPLPSADGKGIAVPDLHLAAESKVALSSKDVRLPDVIVDAFKPTIEQALDDKLKEAMSALDRVNNVSVPLPGGGNLSLGTFDVTVVSVKSIDGELQANVRMVGEASGTAPL